MKGKIMKKEKLTKKAEVDLNPKTRVPEKAETQV